jgi:periplasmic divalent cation tolerance protein
MSEYCVILSTVGSIEEARKIATELVNRKLVACVNLLPAIESIYRWEGKVENGTEVLLLMKTTSENQASVLSALKDLHSYEVPEGLVLQVLDGFESYLDWISASTQKRV